MGRNIRFWIAPGLKNDNVLTPSTLTLYADGRVAVIEVRPPLNGEQGWQCWPDTPLEAQVRELLADWGGGAPGWTATHAEENGNAADCFYITVLAAFDLPALPATAAPRHSINPIRLHTQGLKPGAEVKAANELDAKLNAHLVATWKAQTPMPAGRDVAFWLNPIANAMDRMEEIGGPQDGYYLEVMDWVAKEAARRAKVLRGNLSRTEITDKPRTFNIELEIDGDPNDAYTVIENLLDAGRIQRLINSHNHADAGKLRVTSAVLK